jgi:hypothetical protein
MALCEVVHTGDYFPDAAEMWIANETTCHEAALQRLF